MILLFVLLVTGSQHASGVQVQVQVQVQDGAGRVLLPCQVDVSVSSGSTAVWDREDLKVPAVHARTPGGDYLKDQNQVYKDRTSMREDALRTGDLGLTLRRPTFTDSGSYTCTVRRLGEDRHRAVVELQVTAPPAPTWPWVLLAILVLLGVLALTGGVLYCRRRRKHRIGTLVESEHEDSESRT